MHAIVWEPECSPADIDPAPGSTDVIAMLRRRDGHHATGIVVATGSSVLGMSPGDTIRFPMLDLSDRAVSCLIGFAKIPSNGHLLVRIPLAEYNADVVERVPTHRANRASERDSDTPSRRAWQSLLRSNEPD